MLFEVPSFYLKKININLNKIIEYIYPPTCIICDAKSSNYICSKCDKRIKQYESNRFLTPKDDNNINRSYEYLYYIFQYEKLIRKIMIDYKFFSKPYISHFFAYKILNNNYLCKKLELYDYIIPIPMSPRKEKQRGYNQTNLISTIISKHLKIEQSHILKRIKNSPTQGKLSKIERENNIKGTFYIEEKQQIQNKKVILLDDIYTTGNTIEGCSQVLKESGVKEIFVIIIAKDFMKY